MDANKQGPLSLWLRGPKGEFHVTSMVLYGEMARLPLLLAMVSPEQATADAPEVDAGPYRLYAQEGGLWTTPFGVTHWFVESITLLTRPQHRPSFCVRLGVLPGQNLPVSGYAVDGAPFKTVVQQMCDRYLGSRTIENEFKGESPELGTVVSFGETFEQFLRRMALATDTWVWAQEIEAEAGVLRLCWQERLQGEAVADVPPWNAVRVAEQHSAAPEAVRTFWPRGTVTNVPDSHVSPHLRTLERINPLPLPTDSYEMTIETVRVWQSDFYLSDNFAYANAWPGLRAEDENIMVAAIHVYDEAANGNIRRLLGPLVPGVRAEGIVPTLAPDAVYGTLAVSAQAGGDYVSAMATMERLQMLTHAEALATALGIQAPAAPASPGHSLNVMLASVCPWDADISASWAAGGTGGTAKHSTEIKICFDWSDVPVRIPYAYPMSGSEGVMFCPPSAGDRVLVLLDRMWPIVACHAYQCGDVLLPGVLRQGADIDTLSAQRGMVVKGGLIFRTASNGDMVIHAAGNLVLRADKDIFLDGQHLREHGRSADGRDDSFRS